MNFSNSMLRVAVIITNCHLQRNTSLAEIAQLGERQTEDLKVPGSMPESLIEL